MDSLISPTSLTVLQGSLRDSHRRRDKVPECFITEQIATEKREKIAIDCVSRLQTYRIVESSRKCYERDLEVSATKGAESGIDWLNERSDQS